MRTVGTYLLMAVMMAGLAWALVVGLERQEYLDQAKTAEHINSLLYQ